MKSMLKVTSVHLKNKRTDTEERTYLTSRACRTGPDVLGLRVRANYPSRQKFSKMHLNGRKMDVFC